MKKLYVLFVVAVILVFYNADICKAQWYPQQSGTTDALLEVKFINSTTGFISARNGKILKTTNAGENWALMHSGLPGKSMCGFSVINENTIYSVGYFETIIKSTNGGLNWIIIKNGPYGEGHSYNNVFFINENTGWICGSGQLVFKTTNGGISFDSTWINVGYAYDMYFKNANEGLLCGEGADMYKTTDGGSSWRMIEMVPMGTPMPDLFRMLFFDENTGYTQGVQGGKLFKTTNFGDSWDTIRSVEYWPSNDDLYTFYFPNLLSGWCAGTYGCMFHTTNGGYNWTQVNFSPYNPGWFSGLWFINDTVGWAVGSPGTIFHTTNGGFTFISTDITEVITDFVLSQNYPNPFNSQTVIEFKVNRRDSYSLNIYDVSGREIKKTNYINLSPGIYKLRFDAENFASGIYYYQLNNSVETKTKKMVLIK